MFDPFADKNNLDSLLFQHLSLDPIAPSLSSRSSSSTSLPFLDTRDVSNAQQSYAASRPSNRPVALRGLGPTDQPSLQQSYPSWDVLFSGEGPFARPVTAPPLFPLPPPARPFQSMKAPFHTFRPSQDSSFDSYNSSYYGQPSYHTQDQQQHRMFNVHV